QYLVMSGIRWDTQRITKNIGSQIQEPQSKPRTFETGIACDKNFFAFIHVAKHVFQSLRYLIQQKIMTTAMSYQPTAKS
ncbi:MAG TPA: hypothetical protein VMW89_16470, partial [Desulfatiglandales bacterium]|nr:hypothetical protein [Desulfatiglandales bacterium]